MSFSAVFFFLALSTAYALALYRWWDYALPRATSSRAFLLCTLVIGTIPYICGLVAVMSVAAFPHQSDFFYISMQFGSAVVLWGLGKVLPVSQISGATQLRIEGAWTVLDKTLLVTLALMLAAMFLLAILLPLSSNDPLEYALVGREIYLQREMSAYPLMSSAASVSGMYAPWTHPPLYVGLVFMGNVLQGNADLPGYMKLVAPTLTATSVLLIYWLGSQMNRRVGLLSAIIFLSTPFLFSQAVDAAIDALAIQGLLAAIIAILVCRPMSLLRGQVISGVLLGLSLWSHSQAILFPALLGAAVLVVYGGRINSQFIRTVVVICFVGMLVGCWPYVRNIFIFGGPISDNNAVFALHVLDWTSYFRESRGYDHIADRIQYGIFKGWFSIAIFGASWWFASVGFAVLTWNRSSAIAQVRPILLTCLGIIAIYLTGTAISVILGTDLMIRNDRYMLVLMPYISVLGGWGMYKLAGLFQNSIDGERI